MDYDFSCLTPYGYERIISQEITNQKIELKMKFKINKNLFKVTYEGKEGYVITDENPPSNQEWYYDTLDEESSCPIYKRGLSNSTYKGCLKITASTFPLGDLPQFVIKNNIPNSEYEEGIFGYTDAEIRVAQNAFKEGWDKHAEKYKFTEEDVKKAITLAREVSGMEAVVKQLQNEYLNKEDFQYTEEEIIQFLQQPKEIIEIEFDVEQIGAYANPKYPSDYNLKITKTSEYPNGLLTIKNINYA